MTQLAADTASAPHKTTFIANLLQQIGSVPGATYAMTGLALSLCTNEVWRYPIAMESISTSSPLNNLVIAGTLIALAVLFVRGLGNVLQRPGFVGGVAALATLCLYMYFMSGIEMAAYAARLVFSAAGIALLVCWISTLYKQPPAAAAAIVIASLGLVFCFQAAVSLLSQAVIKGTCALFPCFSALFYILFKNAQTRLAPLGISTVEQPGDEAAQAGFSFAEFARANVGYVLLAVVALCHGLLFAQLHVIWLPAQSQWGAFAIQFSSALGSVVACLALALVSPMPDRRMSLIVCESLLLVFAFFSMWLASAGAATFGAMYLCMLNAAQKTLIYLLFFACLTLPRHNLKVAVFCALYAIHRLGYPINRIVDAGLGGGEAATVVTGAIMLISMAVSTIVLVLVMANPRLLPALPFAHNERDRKDADPSPTTNTQVSEGETEQYKKIAFYFLLGQKYNLTQREIELLPLLSQRQSAKGIADELSISQATAKTHIRNIYAKLDVHTQDDLVDVIDRDRTSLFEQLPSWYLKD